MKITIAPAPSVASSLFVNGNKPSEKNGMLMRQRAMSQDRFQKQPYEIRVLHVSGSNCAACNKSLTLADMKRRGYASGVELGLCNFCSSFVNKTVRSRETDVIDDDDSITDLDEMAAIRELSGYTGGFDEYSE